VTALAPAVAGTWYPADRSDLASLVDRLLDEARGRVRAPRGRARAVIAPHAGYAYSGAVAASAFGALSDEPPSRVVLLGPSHYFGFAGAAVPGRAVAQRTPLGASPLDRESLDALREAPGFRADDRLFAPEHALEAEVPFLQRRFGLDVPLVPILLGATTTADDVALVTASLAPLLDPGAIVVVSSDFTHYGPRFDYVPFVEDVPERLRTLDLAACAEIARGDGRSFSELVARTGATICGRRAIEVFLGLPPGRSGGALLEYDTSGRMTGAWDHSVSYASLVFP